MAGKTKVTKPSGDPYRRPPVPPIKDTPNKKVPLPPRKP